MNRFSAPDFVKQESPGILARLVEHQRLNILYHGDVDGVCAAAGIVAVARSIGVETGQTRRVLTAEFHFDGLLDELRTMHGAIISADINFSSRAGFLAALDDAVGERLIIIDDHVLNESEVTISKALVVNPNKVTTNRPVDLASSLFAYLLAKERGGATRDWIAILGLFFDRQLGAYRSLFDNAPPSNEMFAAIKALSGTYLFPQSTFAEDRGLTHLINAIETNASWSLFLHRLLEDSELREREMQSQAEIERILSGLDKVELLNAARGPLFVLRFVSQALVTNIVASNMRNRLPRGFSLAIRDDGARSQFELRAHDQMSDVDFATVLQVVNSHVRLENFGGHPRAAGGSLLSGRVDQFLAELRRNL